MGQFALPSERRAQDYRSTYNDIREWLRREAAEGENDKSKVDWDDIVFEIDLLKSQEINLDYILELIFDKARKTNNKSDLIEDARRAIRASLGHRAKESLIFDFINKTDVGRLADKASVIDEFYQFARSEQKREADALIQSENLQAEAARRFLIASIKREFATDNGDALNAILPKMSPLNPEFIAKKKSVFRKVSDFVEKFKGVGGSL